MYFHVLKDWKYYLVIQSLPTVQIDHFLAYTHTTIKVFWLSDTLEQFLCTGFLKRI